MNRAELVITSSDRCRLGVRLSSPEGRSWGDSRSLPRLETKLENASSVDANSAPGDLVTMNSKVELVDLQTKSSSIVTLAYPDEVDLVASGVSIFGPQGMALLGRQVGDVVKYPEEGGGRTFVIAEIIYQPERVGERQL